MANARNGHRCRLCGQQFGQWAGRCPFCGAWGAIEAAPLGPSRRPDSRPLAAVPLAAAAVGSQARVSAGTAGVNRVLGGGIVPGSVSLLAGEPGIGKSTLLLHVLAHLSSSGRPCLLVSGEESHAQVASRARRIGVASDLVSFAPGRDLAEVLDIARATHPFLLAVDSIQAIRDAAGAQMPGGVSQVRICADALAGLAKADGIAVLATGHVTKDGDLAGPRALEHAVDVVLSFEGDARSGLRVLAARKNRFGPEGETSWFEMVAGGLREIDPSDLLISGDGSPGSAVGLPLAGRRALAVELQALVGSVDGPVRRQATGLDQRRFALVAAVLDRTAGLPLGRAELFGASSGGVHVHDPACDLAVAAALASAATAVPAPTGSAFLGEVALTGAVRPAASLSARLTAAKAAGCTAAFVPSGSTPRIDGIRTIPVDHVRDAVGWALRPVETAPRARSA